MTGFRCKILCTVDTAANDATKEFMVAQSPDLQNDIRKRNASVAGLGVVLRDQFLAAFDSGPSLLDYMQAPPSRIIVRGALEEVEEDPSEGLQMVVAHDAV